MRTIEPAEAVSFAAAMVRGLLRQPVPGEAEWHAARLEPSRSWAAFDGETIVGTLTSHAVELSVPGAVLPASKIDGVGVASTHRRRGLLTEMITSDLRASAARGEPLAVLIAAEYPIYGRYGFGPASTNVTYTIDARRARLAERADRPVRLLDADAARPHIVAVYERFRRGQPGALDRPDRVWDQVFGVASKPGREHQPAFHVGTVDADGRPDGYLIYRVEQGWTHGLADSTLHVVELVAVDPAAEARLWRHCLEVDWVSTLRASDRAPDELLAHLLMDPGVLRLEDRWPFLWLRLLDVPTTLAARRYPVPGRLVIEVRDPLGYADGRYLLDGGPDGAACQPTNAQAQVSLPASVLASLYLGEGRAALLARAGRITEHETGALARLDAMFRSGTAPWSATWF